MYLCLDGRMYLRTYVRALVRQETESGRRPAGAGWRDGAGGPAGWGVSKAGARRITRVGRMQMQREVPLRWVLGGGATWHAVVR